MITIFDERRGDPIELEDVSEGECFVLGGILYRRLYEHFDGDLDCEYMYSGRRIMFHECTKVIPVDVEITYTETEDYA